MRLIIILAVTTFISMIGDGILVKFVVFILGMTCSTELIRLVLQRMADTQEMQDIDGRLGATVNYFATTVLLVLLGAWQDLRE